ACLFTSDSQQANRCDRAAQPFSVLTTRPNPHSPRHRPASLPDAISCLGAFRPPVASRRAETSLPAAENLHRKRPEQVQQWDCSYSITSSAMLSSVGETLRPSNRAGGRLMTSSNLLDCTTGKSAGLAPLRIRPT